MTAVLAAALMAALALPATAQFQELAKRALPANEDGTQATALGDVDGDGDLDLVVGSGQSRLYVNDGAGTFTEATATQMPTAILGTRSLVLGDVDGDGDLDLVIGNWNQQSRLYLNNGAGTFADATAARMPVGNHYTASLVLGDVDGDSDLDLVVGNGDFAQQQSRLYRNDGTGTFTDATATHLPVGNHDTRSLVLGDVDGDADLDLVLGNGFNQQSRLYRNDGTGVFTDVTTTHLPVGNYGTTSLALGDVDGDGDLDLVLGNGANAFGPSQQSRLYVNDGSGIFADATPTRMPIGSFETRSLALGDVDGDGDLDLVVGNGSVLPGEQSLLYRNDGAGTFTDATVPAMPVGTNLTRSLALGDVDGDGDSDLVLGNDGQRRLYLNSGTGTFADATATRLPVGKFYTRSLALADVDGDGDLDVVMGNSFHPPQQCRLYRNDGTGVMTDATGSSLPVGNHSALSLAAGDVDGDGDPDLVVGSSGPSRLWRNDGTGAFADATAAAMPSGNLGTLSLALGDVDGDGDLDLLLGTDGQNRLYGNDGAGSFTDVTATSMPVDSDYTTALACGDVDGDGDLDLVVGNSGSVFALGQQSRLYRNNGTGTFTDATATSLPVGSQATVALALGDVDGDGDLDLVVGNRSQQSRLYWNDGAGTFSDVTAMRMPVGAFNTQAVALGDVDEDGDLDLVLGNHGQNRLFLNDGAGAFTDATAARMPVGNDLTDALALGDLDGDGDLDQVVGNFSQQSRLHCNLVRQLDAPRVLRVGRTGTLDVYSRHGPPSSVDLAAIWLSTAPASIALPPFGTIGIDLASAVPLQVLTIAQPGGVGSVSFAVPNVPSLIGQAIYSQAMLVGYPNRLRLSGVVIDTMR